MTAPEPAAIAATAEPVQLNVALIEDERIPAEMVCMGTYRNGRLVARTVLAPEAWWAAMSHANEATRDGFSGRMSPGATHG